MTTMMDERQATQTLTRWIKTAVEHDADSEIARLGEIIAGRVDSEALPDYVQTLGPLLLDRFLGSWDCGGPLWTHARDHVFPLANWRRACDDARQLIQEEAAERAERNRRAFEEKCELGARVLAAHQGDTRMEKCQECGQSYEVEIERCRNCDQLIEEGAA